MPKRRVVLTGVGVITPVGNNIPDFWDAVVNGKSGVGPLIAFDCSSFNSRIAAEVKDFDSMRYMTSKQDKRLDLFVKFALAAAKLAFADSGLDREKIA